MSKQIIAIICGGPSSEHEVSCVSAGGVLKGLDRQRFEPLLIGITKSGVWVELPNDYQLEIVNKQMPVIEDNGRHIEVSQSGFSIDGQLLILIVSFPSCTVNLAKMDRSKTYLMKQRWLMLAVVSAHRHKPWIRQLQSCYSHLAA